jgi:hypothetical protein
MAFGLSVLAIGLAAPAGAKAQGWGNGARMARYTYSRTPTTYYYPAQPTRYVYQQPQQPQTVQQYQTMRPAYNTTGYTQNTVQQASTTAQPAAATTATYYGDPYGFTSWLNGVRAQYGLSAVSYDANLESWAHANNAQQAARGLGHFVMGPARRQNAAIGTAATIGWQWMNSPAHRAGLLDPSISRIGLAGSGSYWTFNAY